jgi:hypothetical protein
MSTDNKELCARREEMFMKDIGPWAPYPHHRNSPQHRDRVSGILQTFDQVFYNSDKGSNTSGMRWTARHNMVSLSQLASLLGKPLLIVRQAVPFPLCWDFFQIRTNYGMIAIYIMCEWWQDTMFRWVEIWKKKLAYLLILNWFVLTSSLPW